jgi:uncharacterized protein YqgV (UPF0045/DUF77 family)
MGGGADDMDGMTAQVSLYPLRTAELGPAIDRALSAFREAGLEVIPGPMSTLVAGGEEALFTGLQQAFAAAAHGDQPTVMVVTISNACPVPEHRSDG